MMVEVTQTDRESAWPFRPDCYRTMLDRDNWMLGVFDGLAIIQAFAAHRIAERERCEADCSAQEAELLRLRGALDTICVQSNSDWNEVSANPAGKIKLIHTTAVAARFWREGDG